MPNFRWTGLFTVAPFLGSTKKMRGLPAADTTPDAPYSTAAASEARASGRTTLMMSLLSLEMHIVGRVEDCCNMAGLKAPPYLTRKRENQPPDESRPFAGSKVRTREAAVPAKSRSAVSNTDAIFRRAA